MEGHPRAPRRVGECVGEFVDVSGCIALREETTVMISAQGGFDGAHLLCSNRPALQAAACKQLTDLASVLETLLIAVDMQDAAPFKIECNAFPLGPFEQMTPCIDRQLHGLDGVALVVAD